MSLMVKRSVLTATLLVATLGLASVAQAQSQPLNAQGWLPSFDELDLDGDGRITRDELDAARAARWAAFDTDGDGFLTQAELEAGLVADASKRARERAAQMIERRGNEAGRIALADLEAQVSGRRLGALFDRVDTDRDGAITRSEYDGARERMRERMAERNGQRRGEGHGRGEHRKRSN